MRAFLPGESLHADGMHVSKIASIVIGVLYTPLYAAMWAYDASVFDLAVGAAPLFAAACLGGAWARWSRLSPEQQRAEAAHEDFVASNGGKGRYPRAEQLVDREGHPLDAYGRRSCGCAGHERVIP